LRPTLVEAAGRATSGSEAADRVVRVGTDRAAAVRDDLAVGRQLGEAVLELVERDRAPFNVAGGVLLRWAHVDEHDLAAPEPRDQLVTSDGLDVLAEVVPGRSLHFRPLGDRGLAPYNVSTGRLVRNSEVVAAINAVVPGANITLPEGRNPDRPPDNYLDTTRCGRTPASGRSTTSSAPYRTTSTG
jgi:hypothetical protein